MLQEHRQGCLKDRQDLQSHNWHGCRFHEGNGKERKIVWLDLHWCWQKELYRVLRTFHQTSLIRWYHSDRKIAALRSPLQWDVDVRSTKPHQFHQHVKNDLSIMFYPLSQRRHHTRKNVIYPHNTSPVTLLKKIPSHLFSSYFYNYNVSV